MVPVWAQISTQCLPYAICKTKYCWRSVDSHLHNRVTKISCTALPEKATITFYMSSHLNTTLRSPMLHDQTSLTLRWCSFSRWCRKHIAVVFASKASQYIIYIYLQPVAPWITQDAKPKLVDAPLTLIFTMWQGLYLNPFCLYRLQIRRLCITATKSHFNYLTYRTRNRWRTIDAHYQEIVEMASVAFSPIMAANTVIIHTNYQITFWLPDLQNQKSLTLC